LCGNLAARMVRLARRGRRNDRATQGAILATPMLRQDRTSRSGSAGADSGRDMAEIASRLVALDV
jgi:hypothetical protein